MAKSIPALVEPAMLRWARETIDLAPVAVSRKLDLPDDRVAAWEAGEERPTVAQLRKAAQLYRRSLGVFFLLNRRRASRPCATSAGTGTQRPAHGYPSCTPTAAPPTVRSSTCST